MVLNLLRILGKQSGFKNKKLQIYSQPRQCLSFPDAKQRNYAAKKFDFIQLKKRQGGKRYAEIDKNGCQIT